jgi:hypothetical protein
VGPGPLKIVQEYSRLMELDATIFENLVGDIIYPRLAGANKLAAIDTPQHEA